MNDNTTSRTQKKGDLFFQHTKRIAGNSREVLVGLRTLLTLLTVSASCLTDESSHSPKNFPRKRCGLSRNNSIKCFPYVHPYSNMEQQIVPDTLTAAALLRRTYGKEEKFSGSSLWESYSAIKRWHNASWLPTYRRYIPTFRALFFESADLCLSWFFQAKW